MRRMLRAEIVLPLAIVGAAIILGVSEFMVTFQFTPPGGEPLREQLASDRHTYALLMLAIFTVAAMAFAIATGARVAAIACAAFGGAALLLFLILDLPDAGKLGDLDDPVFGLASARTVPQPGFWLEAAGAVVLGLGSLAFATLGSDQLRAPLSRFGGRRDGEPEDARAEPGAREQSASSLPGPFNLESDEQRARGTSGSRRG